jgi:hypothetical protein
LNLRTFSWGICSITDSERLSERNQCAAAAVEGDRGFASLGGSRWQRAKFANSLHFVEPQVKSGLERDVVAACRPDWAPSSLADFTYVLMGWVNGAIAAIPDLEAHGIPTMEEVIAEYCRLTGRSGLPELNWCFAYNAFRWPASRRASSAAPATAPPTAPRPQPTKRGRRCWPKRRGGSR